MNPGFLKLVHEKTQLWTCRTVSVYRKILGKCLPGSSSFPYRAFCFIHNTGVDFNAHEPARPLAREPCISAGACTGIFKRAGLSIAKISLQRIFGK